MKRKEIDVSGRFDHRLDTSDIAFSPTIDIKLLQRAGVDSSSLFTIIPGF